MNAESAPSPSPAHEPRTSRSRRPGSAARVRLDVDRIGEATRRLDQTLNQRIIGQDGALEVISGAFSRVLANLRDPRRPALSLLLLGPTGVGKTETARAIADALFGDEGALTRVNCEEFAQGHEVSKLMGSPPGYVGYGAEPILSQRKIDEGHRQALAEQRGMIGEGLGRLGELFPADEDRCLSIVLFDEIEKASPTLWNGLLGILDGGQMTLGDGQLTDFTRSIVVMTSNVGSREIAQLFDRTAIGFTTEQGEAPDLDVESAARVAARELFPLEFLSRIDEQLVYRALGEFELGAIFDKFLAELHDRAARQAGFPLKLVVSDEAKGAIVRLGSSLRFGARPLRRAIDTRLVAPLSRLMAAGQISPGDRVFVERRDHEFVFYREPDTSERSIVA